MKKLLFSLLCLSMLLGCGVGGGGGGGGGNDYEDPAHVSLRVDPREIDSGDQLTVTVDVFDVNPDGIMLKIRTPKGLDYIVDSSSFEESDTSRSIDPTTRKSNADYNYVIYFLDRDLFGKDNHGKLSVKFLGTAEVKDGKVEVDPDRNNTQVIDTREFSVSDPRFSAEDSEDVKVRN